jgi:hypothetical protein
MIEMVDTVGAELLHYAKCLCHELELSNQLIGKVDFLVLCCDLAGVLSGIVTLLGCVQAL